MSAQEFFFLLLRAQILRGSFIVYKVNLFDRPIILFCQSNVPVSYLLIPGI